jgi:hypothetical protein
LPGSRAERVRVSAAVDRFVAQLRDFRAPDVFNPWAIFDPAHDASRRAPEIRVRQLAAYLAERASRARLLLVAEAAGYQGAKFSGIAMTSERILLGHLARRGIPPDAVIHAPIERTSRARDKPLGYNEPTATVVWGTLLGAGLDPRVWVNWNAFACHPHRPQALLTNRTPTRAELESARPLLGAFLRLFAGAEVVALGRHAAHSLTLLGVAHRAVRHPSMGGAARFRAEILAIAADLGLSR